jgi:diadenosine tetraphosphatase ApaH/serine/threonine PP2A family protein phosphatase
MWTLTSLTPENRDYLSTLEPGPITVDDEIEVCHGSPIDEDEYLFEPTDAIEAIRTLRAPVCFFGHTHVQVVYWLSGSSFDVIWTGDETATEVPLQRDRQYLINPGSVGQPRDGDPRAAYATYDSSTRLLVLRRVPYAVAEAQAKITAAGLPEGLARRLALGK